MCVNAAVRYLNYKYNFPKNVWICSGAIPTITLKGCLHQQKIMNTRHLLNKSHFNIGIINIGNFNVE